MDVKKLSDEDLKTLKKEVINELKSREDVKRSKMNQKEKMIAELRDEYNEEYSRGGGDFIYANDCCVDYLIENFNFTPPGAVKFFEDNCDKIESVILE